MFASSVAPNNASASLFWQTIYRASVSQVKGVIMAFWLFSRRQEAAPAAQSSDQSTSNTNNTRNLRSRRRISPPIGTHGSIRCPPARGERETLAWANRESPRAVDAILRARDYANHDTSLRAAAPLSRSPRTSAPPRSVLRSSSIAIPRPANRHAAPEDPLSTNNRSSNQLYLNVPEPVEAPSRNEREDRRLLTASRRRRTQRVQFHDEAASAPPVSSADGLGLTLIAPVTVYASGFSLPRHPPVSNSYLSINRGSSDRDADSATPDPGQGNPDSRFSSDSSSDEEDNPQPTAEEVSEETGALVQQQPGDQFGEFAQAVAAAIEPDPSIPPFPPFTDQGQERLDIIRESLHMNPNTPARAVQEYLGRNSSIIRHLVCGTIAHPDWQFPSGTELFELRVWSRTSHRAKVRVWNAITEIYWDDDRVRNVLDMALHPSAGERGWLFHHGLPKARKGMPLALHRRLLAAVPEFAVTSKLRFEEIGRMRRGRPGSLLKDEVPQDE